jgi:hypothetical protein
MHVNKHSITLCINESKEFLIKCLSDEINEIIRILQLTTYDEFETDDLTIVKQKLVKN